ncbi:MULTISPECIES: hypothetical protein [Streptomyces]|uniref:hypothetical protein n=1 Tax=Streptomyces TaxID=1883 RepID=UPI000AAF39CA|nr:hypothetical protein [Streptomyces californicus]QRV59404.1 hypothetical protein I6J40_34665 [Streptomyces californicus]
MSDSNLHLADRRLAEELREQRLVRGLDLITGRYPTFPNATAVGQTEPSKGDQVT